MRETQGYLEIESGAYLEENIFPFWWIYYVELDNYILF